MKFYFDGECNVINELWMKEFLKNMKDNASIYLIYVICLQGMDFLLNKFLKDLLLCINY